MSDDWLIVLAADPLARPPKDRAEAAFELLCSLRNGAEEPELHQVETPEFFDCGCSFDAVFCPFCKKNITDWWGDAMDRWWKGDRRLLAVETPCCQRASSLNDLDYLSSQGFACVAMELMNGGPDLEPAEREQVEEALGLPVRIIWRHI